MKFSSEPAVWLAVISAAISVAVGFGLQWTVDQVTLVNVFVTLAAGIFVRSQVTPVGKLEGLGK